MSLTNDNWDTFWQDDWEEGSYVIKAFWDKYPYYNGNAGWVEGQRAAARYGSRHFAQDAINSMPEDWQECVQVIKLVKKQK